MNILENLFDQFLIVINDNIFNIRIIEIIIILSSLIFAFLVRGLFASIIIKRIRSLIKKSSNKIDDSLFDTLNAPVKILPVIIVLLIISINFQIDSNLSYYLKKLNTTLTTIFIFWLIHQLVLPFAKIFNHLETILTKALFIWITKSIKYLTIFLGLVAVLDVWGIKIGPVIAGLGLFGVAVALGAQDLFKNLISGLMILVEKRFQIDDVIKVPGHVEGIVEQIGFRSTLVRKFDSTPISIPNHIFSENPTLNYSSRYFRRISWVIGLVYHTDIEKLKNITEDIKDYLNSSENYVKDQNFKSYVYIEKFNESSIDIYLATFVNTTDWEIYLKIKEELSFEIKKIIKKNNSDFAYPSRTIYIEKNE